MKASNRVNQLFSAHKFKPSDFHDIDWAQMELLLNVFPQSTFDSLKAKFNDEVDQHVKFYSLLAEIRFARCISSIASNTTFVLRQSVPTPDIRTTIARQFVEFEVSRLVPEKAFVTTTPLPQIISAFRLKVQDELKQLALPVSAVVVVPERNWSVENTYKWILPEVSKALSGFASVPCVIIHLQYIRPSPGWILVNPTATNQMPNGVSAALMSLGFV